MGEWEFDKPNANPAAPLAETAVEACETQGLKRMLPVESKKAGTNNVHTLNRQTFKTSRGLDFFSEKGASSPKRVMTSASGRS